VTISSSSGHGGVTHYSLQVNDGTWVVLTAPETAVSASDGYEYRFVRWWYQGYPFYSTTIAFEMFGYTWVAAEYGKASAGASAASSRVTDEAALATNDCENVVGSR